MKDEIFDIIENALAQNGYKILDGDDKNIFVRLAGKDTDYRITIEEEPGWVQSTGKQSHENRITQKELDPKWVSGSFSEMNSIKQRL